MTGNYGSLDFDRPKKGNGALLWLLLIAIGLLGYSAYMAFHAKSPESAPPTPPPAKQASSRSQADRPQRELGVIESASNVPTLPPQTPTPTALQQTSDAPPQNDVWLRQQLAGLIEEEHYQAWLRNEQLPHKLALLVYNLSDGRLPPRLSSALPRLSAPFAVKALKKDDSLFQLDPAGYQRYQPLLKAFAALDEHVVAGLYQSCKPLLQAAYLELSDGRRDFDAALFAAIDQVLAVQLPKGSIELVRSSVIFKYADPALEKRSPLAKQLIRLGPANVEMLKDKLRRLQTALRPASKPAASAPTPTPMPAPAAPSASRIEGIPLSLPPPTSLAAPTAESPPAPSSKTTASATPKPEIVPSPNRHNRASAKCCRH